MLISERNQKMVGLLPIAVIGLIASFCYADSVEFDYFTRGANWKKLCSSGMHQSPIHLDNLTPPSTDFPAIEINYGSVKYPIKEFTGTSYLVQGEVGSLTAKTVEGDGPFTFTSNSLHFHAPSEHTIAGTHFDLEMHIVHTLSGGDNSYHRNIAVLSVLFSRGERNEFLDSVVTDRGSIGLGELFNEQTYIDTYYAYAGSLTTPPCTENVNWYIHAAVFEAADDQIAFFENQWEDNKNFADGNGNNRNIQPNYDR